MPYTDWIEFVEETIVNKKTLNILEFGLGEGTNYLIKNFNKVFSYELMDDRSWFDKTVNILKENNNWGYKFIHFSEFGFLENSPILPEKLLEDIDNIITSETFDVIFMDGGYHNRGDIVNYIINKFYPKYVIIHDTNFAYKADGYDRIILPENYVTKTYSFGEGTTIFIKQ